MRRDGSVLITPLNPSLDSNIAGNRLWANEKKRGTTRNAHEKQPMETDGTAISKTALKKQQRAARKLQEHQEAMRASAPVRARWLLLAQCQLWATRKETCNAVWTAWMKRPRTPEARLIVWRKLRDLLWRALDSSTDRATSVAPSPAGLYYHPDRTAGAGDALAARRVHPRACQSLHESHASRLRALQGPLVVAGLPASDRLRLHSFGSEESRDGRS